MFNMRLIFVLVSVFVFIDAKNEDYAGHKVYNIKLIEESQADRLHELQKDDIDFWRKPSFKHNVVGRAMVPPSQQVWFEEILAELGIDKDVFVEDVYEHLTKAESKLTRTTRNDNRAFDFQGYYRYDEILAHMYALQEQTATAAIRITVEEFGRTEGNRPVVYMTISDTTTDAGNKGVVIVESGITPREWITIPAALNVVERLRTNATYLSQADWIIVPVVNPDGYEYSHTNLRLWQKSRSTQSNLGFICPGVNINRNFDIDWMVSDSSSSPCSHLYAGVQAFSEVESRMMRHLLETYSSSIRLYISLHNSGGFVSYPWQFERAATGMFRQHLLLGMDMVAAMIDNYRVDVGWSALGDRASGTASDYIHTNGVLYTLNIDVVERGDDGVNVPESEIASVVEDVWRGVSVAAAAVI